MDNKLRIAGIVEESIVDGPGIRFVVFTQGCKHNCPGCHNPHTHSFDGGEIVEIDSIIDSIKENPLLSGVTLSGGEPFEQAKALAELSKKIKELGYNIISYTGYTYEYIIENSSEASGWMDLLKEIDILIDGRFEIEKKSLNLRYKGSSNQRIIDVKKTMASGNIVIASI
jgi:anaerobic ribonucleoside-triphosphate reductase activating protein